MVIGITGSSGSGKSLASQILKERGFFIIDADEISHNIILKGNKCYDEIISFFGDGILKEGEIDRKKLGFVVFNDKEKLQTLNNITHKYILREINTLLQDNRDKDIIIDAPLLFETGLNDKCDKVFIIDAREDIRLERIIKRDNITVQEALNRFKNKKDIREFENQATGVILNNSDKEDLKKELEKFI